MRALYVTVDGRAATGAAQTNLGESPAEEIDTADTVDYVRAYGRVYAAVVNAAVVNIGRRPRGRFADLLIASTALAEGLPLLTRNAADFAGLETLIEIIEV